MTNIPTVSKEDSFKERALQILNLRYLVESDIKSAYRKRMFEYHPDRHPNFSGNPSKMREYEKKVMVLNQAYELLLDVLNGAKINVTTYCLLEDTELVQSLLPGNVKPVPLGKTEQELWLEKYGNLI